MRTTKAEVTAVFIRLCDVLGKSRICWEREPGPANRAVVGAWRLDANPTYGGYVIEEIVNTGGGLRNPLGALRMSGAEFVRRDRPEEQISSFGGQHYDQNL